MPTNTATRLAKSLDKAAADMSKLDAASAEIGSVVEILARRTSPKKDGTLRGSVRFRVGKPTRKMNSRVVVVAGGGRVPYAAVIHWGWKRRNIAPQPFLADAFDRAVRSGVPVDKYTDAVEQVLREALG